MQFRAIFSATIIFLAALAAASPLKEKESGSVTVARSPEAAALSSPNTELIPRWEEEESNLSKRKRPINRSQVARQRQSCQEAQRNLRSIRATDPINRSQLQTIDSCLNTVTTILTTAISINVIDACNNIRIAITISIQLTTTSTCNSGCRTTAQRCARQLQGAMTELQQMNK